MEVLQFSIYPFMGKLKDYGPSQWPNMGKTFTGNKEYVLKNLNLELMQVTHINVL